VETDLDNALPDVLVPNSDDEDQGAPLLVRANGGPRGRLAEATPGTSSTDVLKGKRLSMTAHALAMSDVE
jgi:hypothetical protein